MNLQDFRAKYPMYNNISDMELSDRLHKKHYSHVPREEFMAQIGAPANTSKGHVPEQPKLNTFDQKLQYTLKHLIPEDGGVGETLLGSTQATGADFLRGAGQSIGNLGISAANVLPGVNIPHINWDKYASNSPYEGLTSGLGSLVGGGGAIIKGFGALNKAIPVLNGTGLGAKFGNILRDVGIGGGMGAILGEDEGGDRTAGTVVGAAAPVLAKGAGKLWEGAKKVASPYKLPEQIEKEISGTLRANKKMSNANYKAWAESAKDVPLSTPKKLNETLADLIEDGTPAGKKAVKKWLANPTTDNAASAIKKLGRASSGKGTTDPEVAHLSGQAKNYIEKRMLNDYKKMNRPDLADKYKHALTYWKENVHPIKNNPVIRAWRDEKRTPEALLKDLYTNKEAAKKFGKYLPDIQKDIINSVEIPRDRERIKKAFMKVGIYGVLPGAGIYGANSIMKK